MRWASPPRGTAIPVVMIISAPDSHGVGSSSSLTCAQDTRRPVPPAPAIRRNCKAGERSRSSTLNPDAGMQARLGCEPHSHKPLSCGAHYCHSPRLAATLFRNSNNLDLGSVALQRCGAEGSHGALVQSLNPQSLNPQTLEPRPFNPGPLNPGPLDP